MNFGVQVRPMAGSADLLEVARALEAAGFESIFVPEHTHIPLAVQSLFPDDPGWLEGCKRFLDPFIALAAVAAVTRRLMLGTGVCLLPQHQPIAFAKTVATLDVLSDGRVLIGIGAGWNQPELRNHGIEPRDRWAVMREHALALKAIWTQDEAEFHGAFVDFDPLWSWPKPLRQPHPPLLVGGEGPHVLERVVDYGDAWLPNDHPEVADRMVELQRLADEGGRGSIPTTVYAVEQDRARVEELLAAGAERIVFNLRSRTDADARESVRELAAIIHEYI
jgi:probable F420-dependent oxidoreductase